MAFSERPIPTNFCPILKKKTDLQASITAVVVWCKVKLLLAEFKFASLMRPCWSTLWRSYRTICCACVNLNGTV